MSSPKVRLHADPTALAEAQRRVDKKVRRRAQFKLASRRKRAKKHGQLQSYFPTGGIMQHLSSGDFPDLRPIEALCKLGLPDTQIAEVLGVKLVTFSKWKKMSPRLRAACERGRKIADTHVAESLFQQAIGYSVPEEKIFYDSKRGKVVRAKTLQYYPPNTVAAIFWLKNRFAEFWRDHKGSEEAAQSGPVNIQQVKFVLVQGQVNGAAPSDDNEQVIDGDYKVLPSSVDVSIKKGPDKSLEE